MFSSWALLLRQLQQLSGAKLSDGLQLRGLVAGRGHLQFNVHEREE
jgi:hypothetical protein